MLVPVPPLFLAACLLSQRCMPTSSAAGRLVACLGVVLRCRALCAPASQLCRAGVCRESACSSSHLGLAHSVHVSSACSHSVLNTAHSLPLPVLGMPPRAPASASPTRLMHPLTPLSASLSLSMPPPPRPRAVFTRPSPPAAPLPLAPTCRDASTGQPIEAAAQAITAAAAGGAAGPTYEAVSGSSSCDGQAAAARGGGRVGGAHLRGSGSARGKGGPTCEAAVAQGEGGGGGGGGGPTYAAVSSIGGCQASSPIAPN
jgi:hypothetical protein